MLSALVLDALLIIILLMMIPLGFLRGGLREVCTSAGLLFGIVFAEQWSGRWGGWVADRLGLSEGGSRFLVSIVIVVVATALIGYGGSAAFAYRPGPGGRMYGAYIALFNGIVLIGYLINTVVVTVYDGVNPDPIENGFVSRALSAGFGWVLLVGALGIVAATLFGMFVRERPGENEPFSTGSYPEQRSSNWQMSTPNNAPPQRPAEPVEVEQETETLPASPVRIREVRHWEEVPESGEPQQGYGGGWRQTWPDPKGQGPALPWEQPPPPKPPSARRVSGTLRQDQKNQQKPSSSRDVLRNWMSDDDSGNDR